MTEEWGPWIEHDGSKVCPFQIGQRVQTIGGPWDQFDEWTVNEYAARLKTYHLVKRYRIRRPRGLKILQDLIEKLPETVEA